MAGIIELPPQCFVCREFSYHRGRNELYSCKSICMETNDIYEMWDECPYVHKKYLISQEE